MADAPQVAYADTPPEVSDSQDTSPSMRKHEAVPLATYGYYQGDPAAHRPSVEDPIPVAPAEKHLRWSFWVIMGLVLLLIAAAIGGGVGGSMAVKNARYVQTRSFEVCQLINNRKEAESSSCPNPTAAPNATGTDSFLAVPPTEVSAVDIKCPEDNGPLISDTGDNYECFQYNNCPGSDLVNFVAYRFQDCINACSHWNEITNRYSPTENVTCQGAILATRMASHAKANHGNCWLKGEVTADCLTKSFGESAVRLCSKGVC